MMRQKALRAFELLLDPVLRAGLNFLRRQAATAIGILRGARHAGQPGLRGHATPSRLIQ
jgi:hypothetical protein